MSKKEVEKLWSGSAGFIVKEDFDTVEQATKQPLPSSRAVYEVKNDSVSFEFKRIKKKGVKDAGRTLTVDSLSKDRSGDPGKGKRKENDQRQDNKSQVKK